MNDWLEAIGGAVVLIFGGILVGAGLSLLLAFPVKWCWNYVVARVFGLPVIGWGHAWCLSFLCSVLLKSSLVS